GMGGGSGTSGTGGGLGAGQCRADGDCSVGVEECVAPGATTGGGICDNPPETCTSDSDCAPQGSTFICAPAGCACQGQETCVQGCTSDSACAEGESCAADHHCQPTACSAAGDCPANFTCPSSACERTTCTSDAECEGY